MALPIWQGVVTDESGDVISGAEITVVNEATGTDADIYSDRAGSSSKSNPFFTGSDGFIQFYAAPGSYRITADSAGGTRTWRYEALIDPTTDTSFTGETSLPGGLTDVAGTPDFDNMPTVDGDPIVESGSNSDGEWTRWADGTQMCFLLTAQEANTTISGDSRFLDYNWTFPESFVSGDASVSANTRSYDVPSALRGGAVETSQSGRIRYVAPNEDTFSGSDSVDVIAIAIGRWK